VARCKRPWMIRVESLCPESPVKLVPDPPRRAQMALYSECKTDAAGTCSILGVAPGSYHAFAFAEERQIDFLPDLEDSGKAVSIAEGERRGVELTPPPDN
jgi:hypothetical protein